ncbi:MAG: restriction endonuclease subunit S [Microscillaceae bacterium]|nr:restriction endonuclease subunit S [Microscillaceae bacterium]MDW8460283.1 restriction endonuclease subunit S [Cytophagales bacterium]
MNNPNNPKLIPRLRFPEFQQDGEWVEKRLGEIAELIKEKVGNKKLLTLSVTSGIGLVSQIEKFGRDISGSQYKNYYVVQRFDFAYNKSSTKSFPEGFIAMVKDFDIACVPNSIFICFRPNCLIIYPLFLNYIFENNHHGKHLRNYIEVGARAHGALNVDTEILFSIPIKIPSLAEQQKIAACLSSLDELIEAETQKLELWQTHKKGLLQQLFPQEGEKVPRLRFPEFQQDGEWEEKELRQIAVSYNGLTGKISSDFGSGEPYITYMQVFGNSRIDFSKCGLVKIKPNESQNKVEKGDVLITTSSETPDEVGYASVVTEEPSLPTYLNSFCFGIRFKSKDKIFPEFLCYLFRSEIYRKRVTVLAQGITRFNISKQAFFGIEIPLPSLAEQQKIAVCLSSLDELIEAQREKIELLKLHKKGLLQGLFPEITNL